jgi:hypothetical protein
MPHKTWIIVPVIQKVRKFKKKAAALRSGVVKQQ